MKRLFYTLTAAIAAACLVTSVYAADCCDKAVAAAKAGQACAGCVKAECCKAAIKKLGDEAKPCEKCAKKSDKKSGCPSCPK